MKTYDDAEKFCQNWGSELVKEEKGSGLNEFLCVKVPKVEIVLQAEQPEPKSYLWLILLIIGLVLILLIIIAIIVYR